MKRSIVERTNKSETRLGEQEWENGVVGRIYGMKYCLKDHKDRNRHKNRIKRSGQARLVYVGHTNRKIPTT